MRHHKKNACYYGKRIVTWIRNCTYPESAACKDTLNDAADQHYQDVRSRYRKNDGEIVLFLCDTPPYDILYHTGAISFCNHTRCQQHEGIEDDITTQKYIKQSLYSQNRAYCSCQRNRSLNRCKQVNATERKALKMVTYISK